MGDGLGTKGGNFYGPGTASFIRGGKLSQTGPEGILDSYFLEGGLRTLGFQKGTKIPFQIGPGRLLSTKGPNYKKGGLRRELPKKGMGNSEFPQGGIGWPGTSPGKELGEESWQG